MGGNGETFGPKPSGEVICFSEHFEQQFARRSDQTGQGDFAVAV